MGVDCRPYPVVKAGSKDPYPGWFGTSKKPFSDGPEGYTKAEIDSDLAAMRVQLPKLPEKIGQELKATEVLEPAKTAPRGAKKLKVVLKIPASGNRIAKKKPVQKKQKTVQKKQKTVTILNASVPVIVFKIPAIPDRSKPIKPPSPEKKKVKEFQPPARRSSRVKKSPINS
ncbi:hypothetical protein L873DRAFT_1807616 [Choiromyces venosus 120613-1]|uniref:Uncharacterized protein n=1 Tax=Choiromyces venosus 120613-1 TaxID=1336337 RepID=A0A3N4JKY2_9PEZI|nr:hypothetical protein L873DRAFT_1807616 [Choiromyces venosus 120613-1]